MNPSAKKPVHQPACSPVAPALSGPWASRPRRRSGGHIRDHRDAPMFEEREAPAPAPARTENHRAIHIYPFGIPRSRLEAAIRSSGLPIEIVDDVAAADAVLTMRSYYRSKPAALRDAEERNIRCTSSRATAPSTSNRSSTSSGPR
ncbi:MAG: hypothetical protein IPI33_09455 [Dehalococcoidia bacterium]|nr:hypothetical protein [Dehalococcoidia bacterium]